MTSQLLLCFACGLFGTWLLRVYALRANLLDVPNHRSSHKTVTPRGGGLSIVVVVIGFIAIGDFQSGGLDRGLRYLAGLSLAVAAIGFVDDHKQIAATIRFSCHLTCAIVIVFVLGGFAPLQLGSHVIDMGYAGDVLAIVFIVWFTNLFNFMDGIDGIASVETLTIAGGAFILFGGGSNVLSAVLGALAASTLGFLVWNWPPAKIFMGDVGSGFLGFFLAGIAMLSTATGDVSIWPWLILGGVFIVDATVTLLVRMLRGDSWHSAHRFHAYQILSRKFGSHALVTLGVLVINAVWLLPIAWFAHNSAGAGWWLTAIAWLPLVIVALRIGAGKPE